LTTDSSGADKCVRRHQTVMGNYITASLDIEVDQIATIPGSQVTGRVRLIVHTDSISAESLIVRLTGGEYTCAKYTTIVGNKTHHRQANSSALFLVISFPLTAIIENDCFEKGEYVFPFSIDIPPTGIPSLISNIPGDKGGSCSVKYEVTATMNRLGWFNNWWDPIKGVSEIAVLQAPIQSSAFFPLISYSFPPTDFPLNYLYFFNAGSIRFGHRNSSELVAGEEFDLFYVLQNNSTVDILHGRSPRKPLLVFYLICRNHSILVVIVVL
jgi:hypothetical protein